MSVRALRQVREHASFGGKAVQLGAALRARLPVPDGVALGYALVDEIAEGRGEAERRCQETYERFSGAPLAARSSAVGEDSAAASFAGQHLTRLNVTSTPALVEAVREVWASGRSEAAMGYRRRMGLSDQPRIGVVVQLLVQPTVAGVLFTRHPVTQADERVVEATWGLGEAVVSGLVTPDSFRFRRGGAVVERQAGDKEVEVVARPEGGTEEREVAASRRDQLCLDDDQLAALDELATLCEHHFEGPSDIEFAFEGRRLFLLQRRAVTR